MIDTRKIQTNESVAIDTTVEIVMPKGFGARDTAVAVAGRLKKVGEGFALEAQGSCCLQMACSRCLRPVDIDLPFHISESFAEEEAATGEEIGFSDFTIDILPAVQRNLFLNIPMKPLCAVDCAGLCKQCGMNFNDGDCDCKGEIVNEQFQQLLQMFDD